jgi:hypothetical protein
MNVPDTHQVYPSDIECALLRELNCVTYTVDGGINWLPEKDWELPYKMLEAEFSAAQRAHEREKENLSKAQQQGATVRGRNEEFHKFERSLNRSHLDPREWNRACQDQIKETREQLCWEQGVQEIKEMLLRECENIAYGKLKVFREKLEKARKARQDEVETPDTQVNNQPKAHQNEDTGQSDTHGTEDGTAIGDARKDYQAKFDALAKQIKDIRSKPKRRKKPTRLREMDEEEEQEAN